MADRARSLRVLEGKFSVNVSEVTGALTDFSKVLSDSTNRRAGELRTG